MKRIAAALTALAILLCLSPASFAEEALSRPGVGQIVYVAAGGEGGGYTAEFFLAALDSLTREDDDMCMYFANARIVLKDFFTTRERNRRGVSFAGGETVTAADFDDAGHFTGVYSRGLTAQKPERTPVRSEEGDAAGVITLTRSRGGTVISMGGQAVYGAVRASAMSMAEDYLAHGGDDWGVNESVSFELEPEGEAVRLATALEIYVSGSLNVFNHETNVDLNRRLVCLDLKKLGAGLRTIAMLIMQDLVNSQVSMNFLRGIATWCYFDEFHVLLRDRLTASYCVAIWKMLRKKGCVPSALTQNVKDFLASPEIENIFENSDFLVLLSQAQGDRQILAKQLGISPHQLSYVTHTNSGEGLLFFGNTTIPFVDRFPQNTELYAIMTTRPEDKKQEMNRA